MVINRAFASRSNLACCFDLIRGMLEIVGWIVHGGFEGGDCRESCIVKEARPGGRRRRENGLKVR